MLNQPEVGVITLSAISLGARRGGQRTEALRVRRLAPVRQDRLRATCEGLRLPEELAGEGGSLRIGLRWATLPLRFRKANTRDVCIINQIAHKCVARGAGSRPTTSRRFCKSEEDSRYNHTVDPPEIASRRFAIAFRRLSHAPTPVGAAHHTVLVCGTDVPRVAASLWNVIAGKLSRATSTW